jgi:hypothetical protein
MDARAKRVLAANLATSRSPVELDAEAVTMSICYQ